VEATTVVIEVVDEFFGGDVCVEQADVLEVLVPNFFHGIANELGYSAFGGVEGLVVADYSCVFGLAACLYNQ
jgi:hypothetical protein